MDVDSHENDATMNGTNPETNGSDFPELTTPLQQEELEEQNPSVVKPERKGYQSCLVLTGHTMSVSALKFSPDGSFIASACKRSAVCVYKVVSIADDELPRNSGGYTHQALGWLHWRYPAQTFRP